MELFEDPILLTDSQPRIFDSVFNVTGLVSNLFNGSDNALVTYVGALVLFVVLVEIALYALDVYANQTYTKPLDFTKRYDNGDDPNSIFQDYPPYPDPYMTTYRSFSGGFDISKILEWLYLLNDGYNMADSTLSNFNCQRRAVCEIWRKENGFKSLDFLDTLLKYSDMINLPEDLNYIIDELKDARYDISETDTPCEDIFPSCPSESIVSILNHMKKLMK